MFKTRSCGLNAKELEEECLNPWIWKLPLTNSPALFFTKRELCGSLEAMEDLGSGK